MTIRFKLLAGFSVLLSILLLLSFISYKQLNTVEEEFNQYIRRDIKLLDTAQNILISHALAESTLKSYILINDKQHLEEYNNYDRETDTYLEQLQKLSYKEETGQLVKKIISAMNAYDKYVEQILVFKENGQTEELLMYMHENRKISGEFNDAVINLVEFQSKDASSVENTIHIKTDRVDKIVIALSIIGLLLGLLTALIISRMITLPLKRITQSAVLISKGDFTGENIGVYSKDELGILAGSFNQMRENIKEIVGGVINVSSKMILAIDGLSRQAVQTAAAATENASTVTEISASVDQMTQNTQEVSGFSNEAVQKAEDGSQRIDQVISHMEIITVSSNQASAVLNELAGILEQINKIIELITGIADQTNLLALNAAIEAARAGDQGRGFAVVAEEVRKLAEQSTTASKEINNLINGVQEESARAVAAMNNGNARVREGAKVINETGGSFRAIIDSIGGLSRQVQDLAAASQQISASVQNVAATTEEQTAAMEEVSATADELTKMARELEAMAVRFKI
ncbi:MAG: methyl-accepting chemotaxis protein [Bacillota bacterium]